MAVNTYDYFLFDWDGCLAKTLEVWLVAYKSSMAARGVTPSDEEISRHFGDWELPKYFGVDDFETCNVEAVETARQRLRKVSLYDGAKELLEALRGKKRMALLSSASKDILLNGVTHNGIMDYFEAILSGEDVENHKPDPEIIEKGLLALGGTKEKTIMIGDLRKDLEAASNAGVDSVLIYPPSHAVFYSLDELKAYKPTHIFNSLSELKQQLDFDL